MIFRGIILVLLLLLSWAQNSQAKVINPDQVGAAQLQSYLPLLTNKRVGLVVNQTSMVGQQHLVDLLLSHGVKVEKIFAPEHGFRGDKGAGEIIDSSVDGKTGIKIVSIYGKNKRPKPEVMADLDLVVFDIQDVGVRFYTYISSMHYMMQAAAESGVQFVVLDRPNPNLQYVDGPVLQAQFRSFVGMHPIPILHGLTVGELAQMIVGEGWLTINAANKAQSAKLDLTVIPVVNYQRRDSYSLPVPPSPNLPNDKAIELYPSLCFFEATPVSIGRGTDWPFQVIGYDKTEVGEMEFEFTPRKIPNAAPYPKLENVLLSGQNLTEASINGLDLAPFIQWHSKFNGIDANFFERADFMDKLAGTDQIRKDIQAGLSQGQIKAKWQSSLADYHNKRAPYLLYQ